MTASYRGKCPECGDGKKKKPVNDESLTGLFYSPGHS